MLLCSQFQRKYGDRIGKLEEGEGKNEILLIKQIHIAVLHNFLDEIDHLRTATFAILSYPPACTFLPAHKFVVLQYFSHFCLHFIAVLLY